MGNYYLKDPEEDDRLKIRMNFGEVTCKDGWWTELAQDRVLVLTVFKFCCADASGIILLKESVPKKSIKRLSSVSEIGRVNKMSDYRQMRGCESLPWRTETVLTQSRDSWLH